MKIIVKIWLLLQIAYLKWQTRRLEKEHERLLQERDRLLALPPCYCAKCQEKMARIRAAMGEKWLKSTQEDEVT